MKLPVAGGDAQRKRPHLEVGVKGDAFSSAEPFRSVKGDAFSSAEPNKTILYDAYWISKPIITIIYDAT